MLRKNQNKLLVGFFGLTVLVAAGVFVLQNHGTQAQVAAQVEQEQESVRGTIRERQIHVWNELAWREQVPLSTLVSQSSDVVAGTVLSNRCKSGQDWRQTTTEYKIRVEQTFKGGTEPNATILVSLPGGLIKQDEQFFEVQTPNFKKMRNRRQYLLFLRPGTSRDRILMPTRGPQGIFELPPTNSTEQRVFHFGFNNEVAPTRNEPRLDDLLRQVREAVRNQR